MKKSSVKYLFDKACDSSLTPEEIGEVMERLQEYLTDKTPLPPYELWSLLHTLGFVGTRMGVKPEYKELLEKFLVYPKFPYISAEALAILWKEWNLTNEYRDEIKSFIRGVDWDNGIVRSVAIKAAGDLMRNVEDKECLKDLLSILDNIEEGWEVRYLAFLSISKALGVDLGKAPYIDSGNLSDRDHLELFAKEIIERARRTAF